MGRRRRSTTASCAGPSAAYGRASSARWRAPGMCRIACSSTQAASRSTAAPAAQKGGLGSWYRPHELPPRSASRINGPRLAGADPRLLVGPDRSSEARTGSRDSRALSRFLPQHPLRTDRTSVVFVNCFSVRFFLVFLLFFYTNNFFFILFFF